jgi:hypothetical protein
MKIIRLLTFCLLALLPLAGFAAPGYPEINVKVTNLMYNSVTDAIEFDISFKAGDDYVAWSNTAGRWIAGNIYYDLTFKTAGVTIDSDYELTYKGTTIYPTGSAHGVGTLGVIRITPDAGTNFGFSLNIQRAVAAELSNRYIQIAHIVLPVTSSVKPTAEDLKLVQRTWDYPGVFHSAWSNDYPRDKGGVYGNGMFTPDDGACSEDIILIWSGAVDKNWNNPLNWYRWAKNESDRMTLYSNNTPQNDLYPDECTDVYIPGDYLNVANYPVLTGTKTDDVGSSTNVCRNIYFLQGSRVQNLHLLNYQQAHVSLNYGLESKTQTKFNASINGSGVATDSQEYYLFENPNTTNHLALLAGRSGQALSRDRWYMLSSPLKKMLSGDFGFGGHPRTFIRKFTPETITVAGSELEFGTWTGTFADYSIELGAGEGFSMWINRYQDKANYRESGEREDALITTGSRKFGLAEVNGILEFPFSTKGEMLQARRAIKRVGDTDYFYYYLNDQDGVLNLITNLDDFGEDHGRDNIYDDHERSASDMHKLHSDEDVITIQLPLPEDGDISQPRQVFIGNPTMSTLDLMTFLMENNAKLAAPYADGYTYWSGVDYIPYNFGQTASVGRYLAPMQGFILKVAAGATELKITQSTMTNADNGSVLKSPSKALLNNTLSVNAVNNFDQSETFICHLITADNGYVEGEDMVKMFSPHTDLPNVFSYVDNKALTHNYVNENVTVPIGFFSELKGEVIFTITGMTNYAAESIEFIDTKLDKTFVITGMEAFTHTITLTDEDADLITDRFFIRLGGGVGMGDITDNQMNAWICDTGICMVSSTSNLIEKADVYNVQGQLLVREENINSDIHTIDMHIEQGIVYVLRLETENGIKNIKLMK